MHDEVALRTMFQGISWRSRFSMNYIFPQTITGRAGDHARNTGPRRNSGHANRYVVKPNPENACPTYVTSGRLANVGALKS